MFQSLRYLQAPHIEIGAYWGTIAEHEAFRRVLEWLLKRGYRMAPEVLCASAEAEPMSQGEK